MFAAARLQSAQSRYQQVAVEARVEGATAHELVVILFEELLKALDGAVLAAGAGNLAKRAERQTRALALLQGLETSLDHARGGEIATTLARIYAHAARLIGTPADPVTGVEQARALIADIAGAWGQIGGRAN